MIPIVVGVLGAVPRTSFEDLEELEIGRRIKTIQTTALLKLARILRKILEIFYHLAILLKQIKLFIQILLREDSIYLK